MVITTALIVGSLLLDRVAAIPWPGPIPTQAGLMPMAGMSLRPTDAPGFEGIPPALRRRDVVSPPLDNWCGLVTGDPSESTSRSSRDFL